jgi:signal transduction histidine kinase
VSDLTKPENRYEADQGKLLEVYLPIRSPGGQRLLFEAYFRYGAVAESGSRVWRSVAPITLGALIALELVQIPLAWSLASRLRQRQREREGLLRQTVEASEIERRRIASDLHDGVVQDLAGVALSLSAASRSGVDQTTADLLDHSSAEVRDTIKSLRSLLVEIYPPNLVDEGIESALTDLLAKANTRGITTHLDVDATLVNLPDAVAGLVYRSAQEALRNVLAHAHAANVSIRLASPDSKVVLEVTDDGIGFDGDPKAPDDEGHHFGLRGLSALVNDAGGAVDVRSALGAGTTVRVEVPVA